MFEKAELTGNATVDRMREFAIHGNIAPLSCFSSVLRENKKPHLLAITILADLIYWFRPTIVRDETLGIVTGWKKKFKGDMLQKNYSDYADLFKKPKRSVKAAFDVLVDLGVVIRIFRNVKVVNKEWIILVDGEKPEKADKVLYNVMYLDLDMKVLRKILGFNEVSANKEYGCKSGNKTVDEMGELNITGNVTPMEWFTTILRDKGDAHLLAIIILSDIVYWYRPTEIRDEQSGFVIGWHKKFKADLLQKSYSDYEKVLGESKRTIKAAFDLLEEIGVVKRVFRNVKVTSEGMIALKDGEKADDTDKVFYNVMYIELNVDKLHELNLKVRSQHPLL